MPTVSVVMPVYNVEKYVAASIDSVLEQTFENFELILVDDGGTDRSMDICRSFNDPRVRIVSQANRGLPGARNTGIRQARGEFIAIIDSDDLWRPEKLVCHVAHLRSRPEVGVSYSASEFIDGEGKSLGLSMRPKLTDITAADIFCRNPIGNGSVPVFRREMLDAIAYTVEHCGSSELRYFDESFRYCEDIECWTRIALTTNWKFEGLPECLTRYRVVSGGLSANTTRMYEFWRKTRDKAASYAPDFVARYGQRAEGYQLRYYARRAVKEGEGPSALRLLGRALGMYPRMVVEEPARTAITIAAALAICLIPSRALQGTMQYGRRLASGSA